MEICCLNKASIFIYVNANATVGMAVRERDVKISIQGTRLYGI